MQPPSYVPLVILMVAETVTLPEDEQVAPVMLPPPLLEEELLELELELLLLDEELLLELEELELLELELLLELEELELLLLDDEEPVFEYEQ